MINCTFEKGNKASLRHVTAEAIVIKGDSVLMVKRAATLLEGGKWGLVGGFLERDETVAQGAEREILEETGWKVTDVKLFTVIDRPDRRGEDRQNIAFVYICQATEKAGEADWESDERRWFKLSSLPPKEQIAFDHADDLALYQEYLNKPFSLPLLGQAI